MSIKKSVMITDQAHEIMKLRTDKRNPDNSIAWSNQVNRALILNDYLFRVSLPDLTDGEWQVILNAYAGTVGTLEHPPFRVASDLMDDLGLINVEDHPNPDLVKRIHNMTEVERFAILQFAEIFWNNDWSDVIDFRQIVNDIVGDRY